MPDEPTCDLHEDIYIDETVGYHVAIAEFVENMEDFQYDPD